jgi:catechol 2,3-dioxygenase-like lactoylglutathione lyase family enzyme
MKPQPLIAVQDVEASSAWYRRILGCQSGHGGREYEQLVRDGELLMQLHHWGDHDHPNLGDPECGLPWSWGPALVRNRRLRWPVANARALGARVIMKRRTNGGRRWPQCDRTSAPGFSDRDKLP